MINRRNLIKMGALGGAGLALGQPTQASGQPGTLSGTFTDNDGNIIDLSGDVTVTGTSGTIDIFGATATPRIAYWSDPATWGGLVPAPGDDVVLTRDVVLDADVTVGTLTIPAGATLTFEHTRNLTLQASGNIVVEGTLQIRPVEDVTHTVRFIDVDESAYIGGGMTPLESDVGLWVMGPGVLDIAGTEKTSWVRATCNVPAGTSTITLATTPVGWRAGDSIVIAPTGGIDNTGGYDRLTIAAINGPTISLSAPLTFSHPYVDVCSGFGYGAEVINLTRNTVIEGTPGGRAHVFMMPDTPQHISHVELRHLGPRQPSDRYTAGVVGRYPLHIHMAGDGTRGSTITGVVVHDCGNKAFVPHLSNGITFTGCTAHDTYDNAFWWDVGDESHDIVWQSCVGSLVRADPVFRGYSLDAFTLGQGNGNKLIDCTAVGVLGNANAGGISWPEGATSAWEVTRVVAHNNRRHGFTVWQNSPVPHLTTDFICAHNGGAGISHGAYRNIYQYDNAWLFANKQSSIILHALSRDTGPLRFSRHICVGEGLHPNAVQLPNHTQPAMRPVEFLGCRFTGHTGATVASVPTTTSSQPDVVDFVECGAPTVQWNSNSKPTSAIRVQDGTTATLHTPAGVTAILPFSTYVPQAAVPFTVAQAA